MDDIGSAVVLGASAMAVVFFLAHPFVGTLCVLAVADALSD